MTTLFYAYVLINLLKIYVFISEDDMSLDEFYNMQN